MTSSTPKAEEPSITPLGVPSGQDVPDAEKGETEPPVKAEEVISVNAQAGVRAIEAATTVWTKWHLIAAYFMIWWIYFISTLQEVVLGSLNPYVVSAFRLHLLTAAVGIIANIIGGLSKIPLAKLLDTWGRP